ncbi:19699_t:CDS:1, partial [Racocetra fulgida]
MPILPSLLNKYIIKSNIKLNQSNYKTFCKYCVEVLGEEEGKKNYFPNKKYRILQHLKK